MPPLQNTLRGRRVPVAPAAAATTAVDATANDAIAHDVYLTSVLESASSMAVGGGSGGGVGGGDDGLDGYSGDGGPAVPPTLPSSVGEPSASAPDPALPAGGSFHDVSVVAVAMEANVALGSTGEVDASVLPSLAAPADVDPSSDAPAVAALMPGTPDPVDAVESVGHGEEDESGIDGAASLARGVKRQRSHECTMEGCGAVFRKKFQLVRHMCRHTGRKPFMCDSPGCEKSFMSRAKLLMHAEKHRTCGPVWVWLWRSGGRLVWFAIGNCGDESPLPVCITLTPLTSAWPP